MNLLNYQFTLGQRRTFDRYINMLGSFYPVFKNIPIVFERRRRAGHKLATLAADSRLNNACFNNRYLSEYWLRVNEARILCSRYLDDLATFTQECRNIMEQTSKRDPVSKLDYRVFTLADSKRWKLYPPRNVSDLVHELNLRFYEFAASMRQLKYTISEVYWESFGLNAVVMRALEHRSCHCHAHPMVVVELFQEPLTSPHWDIDYSSTQASVMAGEYQADIAMLFKNFATVNSQIGLVVEDIYQRTDRVILELTQATYAVKIGELIFELSTALTSAVQCRHMISELEEWLREEGPCSQGPSL